MQEVNFRYSLLVLGFVCLLLILILAIGIIVILVANVKRNTSRNRDDKPRTIHEPSYQTGKAAGVLLNSIAWQDDVLDDGFWLNTSAYALGTIVDLRYFIDGRPSQRSVTVQSTPKQFVYTGKIPNDVRLLNVLPLESNEQAYSVDSNSTDNSFVPPQLFESTSVPDTSNAKESFQGYPPAY